MKVSLTLRDGDVPVLLRGKLPISALGFPLFCGFTLGKKAEDMAFRVGSVPVAGPSCELAYRPKDAAHPLAVVLKTGVGRCAILTMSAEFDPKHGSAPSFRLCFKPRLGDFAATRRFSSVSAEDAATSSSSAFAPATATATAAAGFPSSSEFENPWMSAFHSHSGMGGSGGGSDMIHTTVDADWEHLGGGASEPPLAPLYSGPTTPPPLDPPPSHARVVTERIPSMKSVHRLLTGSCIHARTAFAFPFNTRLTMRWKMHHAPPVGNAYTSTSVYASNTDDRTLKGALLKLVPSLPILLVDKVTFERHRTAMAGGGRSDYRPSECTVSHLGESLALVKESLNEIRSENRVLHQAMDTIRAEMGKKGGKGLKMEEKSYVEEHPPPPHQKGSVF